MTTAADGPATLTTVGSENTTVPLQVHSRNGDFKLAMVDGVKALQLDGKVVTYTDGASSQPLQANNDISLMGVLELPNESVAWVIVIGGTACPASQFLVSARTGQYPRVVPIDGCDDRGTLTKSGGKIAIDIGGRPGSYQDGQLTMDPAG